MIYSFNPIPVSMLGFGRLILSSNSGSKIKLDISEVKKSIYILKVYSEGSFVQKKIVVQ